MDSHFTIVLVKWLSNLWLFSKGELLEVEFLSPGAGVGLRLPALGAQLTSPLALLPASLALCQHSPDPPERRG